MKAHCIIGNAADDAARTTPINGIKTTNGVKKSPLLSRGAPRDREARVRRLCTSRPPHLSRPRLFKRFQRGYSRKESCTCGVSCWGHDAHLQHDDGVAGCGGGGGGPATDAHEQRVAGLYASGAARGAASAEPGRTFSSQTGARNHKRRGSVVSSCLRQRTKAHSALARRRYGARPIRFGKGLG